MLNVFVIIMKLPIKVLKGESLFKLAVDNRGNITDTLGVQTQTGPVVHTIQNHQLTEKTCIWIVDGNQSTQRRTTQAPRVPANTQQSPTRPAGLPHNLHPLRLQRKPPHHHVTIMFSNISYEAKKRKQQNIISVFSNSRTQSPRGGEQLPAVCAPSHVSSPGPAVV